MTDFSLIAEEGVSPLAQQPALYVVATPLGNLRDVTLRALAVLKTVDVIAAEDTRHSQGLLDAFGIRKRLVAVHEHNEMEAAEGLIGRLARGEHVALISDAGTPAVSDPGARVVERIRAAGYPVVPVPGACAAIAALSVSGLVGGSFRFVGFLPPKSAARRAVLADLCGDSGMLVFYEAPHRVVECINDLLDTLGGERTLVIAREMTKRYEEIVRLPLDEAPAWLAADVNRTRGEFVLIVSGALPVQGMNRETERVLKVLLDVLPLKTAVTATAEITGMSRKVLYARALALRGEDLPL